MTDYTTIERSIVINSAAAHVRPHLSDFRDWVAWSPWEGRDPDLNRTYTGTQGTVGAQYAWAGNRKAGAGTMTATAISDEAVDLDLAFTRPFASTSAVHFALIEHKGTTTVVWTLTSPKTVMSRVLGRVMNMDKMIGADLDKGLASLKTVAEQA